MKKVLCFFRRMDGSIESELLELHIVEKYKIEVPDLKDPSRLVWKTFERGFVYSPTYGIQAIDTGLIGEVNNKNAAKLMRRLQMKDRIASFDKNQLLLEKIEVDSEA